MRTSSLLAALAGLALAPAPASAQSARGVSQGKADPAAKAVAAQAWHGALADSRQKAAAGDHAAAEAALASSVSAPPATADWSFELAQKLVQLAGDLSRTGDVVATKAAAARALRNLNDAARTAQTTNLKAAIQQQIGFIQERYLGNLEAAKAAYREGARIAPRRAGADEKLEQIEQSEVNARPRTATE